MVDIRYHDSRLNVGIFSISVPARDTPRNATLLNVNSGFKKSKNAPARWMALTPRTTYSSSGWSKKNDSPNMASTQNSSMRLPWKGLRRRRIFQGLVAVILIYLFVRNIPTDVPSVGRRYNKNFGSLASGHSKAYADTQPVGIPNKHDELGHALYGGPIRFTNLSGSLRLAMARSKRNNVVFAVTSHKSAQYMLPLICNMPQYNRSTVHVAVMGKQDFSIRDIMKYNSISEEDCNVMWHDATPDNAVESSPERLRASVQTVLPYIHSALQPLVILVDDLSFSDPQTLAVLKGATHHLGLPLVTLPAYGMESMEWVAALDGYSLRQFSDVQIEILIQAYSESAGSLIRLLRSLQNANYYGLPVPRLTIELPPKVDIFLTNYLSGLRWPPGSSAQDNQLTVRHRIDSKQISPAQASLRMIESFYPSAPSRSHVLVLSADTELAPDYMRYLMFTLLEYKYAEASYEWSNFVIGISLEFPQAKLDGSKPFLDPAQLGRGGLMQSQMPNSNAALYFGDRWVEFHDFLAKRLAADPKLTQHDGAEIITVSQHYPQWLAQASELMIAQGYTMLYPAFVQKDTTLVVVHTDLHQAPEEFVQPEPDKHSVKSADDYVKLIAEQSVLTGDNMFKSTPDTTIDPTPKSILTLLGINPSKPDTNLPRLATLPLFSSTGELRSREQVVQSSLDFADKFAMGVGGCSARNARNRGPLGSVDNLFCIPD